MENELLTPLKVKVDQMERVKMNRAKLMSDYFIFPQQKDIYEAEADLEDMEERL